MDGIWCTFSLQQWSRLPLMKVKIPLVFYQEALQRVFNGVMASLVFTNVFFCISESKKPTYDITETHCGRPNNSLTSPRLLSTWLQAESGSTCVCTWVWTSGLSESTSKIRMMMRKVARTKGIYHLLYLVCLSKPRKGLLRDVWSLGCLSFQGSQGVSVHWHSHWLVSMGMGTLPWQQDLDRYATKWDKPFQRGCIILVPTINWNFRDMQTLYCSWN